MYIAYTKRAGNETKIRPYTKYGNYVTRIIKMYIYYCKFIISHIISFFFFWSISRNNILL